MGRVRHAAKEGARPEDLVGEVAEAVDVGRHGGGGAALGEDAPDLGGAIATRAASGKWYTNKNPLFFIENT